MPRSPKATAPAASTEAPAAPPTKVRLPRKPRAKTLTIGQIYSAVTSDQTMRKKAKILPKILLLYRDGCNAHVISQYTKVSPGAITKWLKELGLTFDDHPNREAVQNTFFSDSPDPLGDEILRQLSEATTEGLHIQQQIAARFLFLIRQELDKHNKPKGPRDISDRTAKQAEEAQLHARAEEEKMMLKVSATQATPAEQYQAYAATVGIRLLRDGLSGIRPPRTVKEMSELDQLIRRNLGLSAKNAGVGNAPLKIDISILNNTKADRGNGSVNAYKISPATTMDVEVSVGGAESGEETE